jgi:hypothetical protein
MCKSFLMLLTYSFYYVSSILVGISQPISNMFSHLSLLLLMRHYLGAFPIPTDTTLVIVGHLWTDILGESVVGVFVHSSKRALYCDDLVLSRFLGHRVEQQAIASLVALESCVPAASSPSEEPCRRILELRQETQLAVYRSSC